MLSPVFWLVFLGTFLVLKTLADGWLGLPKARRRVPVGAHEEVEAVEVPALRRAA